MGRILVVDPVSGVAGDMLCAALIDLGADLDAVKAGLEGLGLSGYRVSVEQTRRGVFAARRFIVTPDAPALTVLPLDHGHDHSHGHGHSHDHGHDHGHGPAPWPGQQHRTWRDIRALLTAAELPQRARRRALDTFALLAAAEGRVHGHPPDEVHFHEVGALDSIVDITAACLALELLDVAEIICAPLPLSMGTITTAHGTTPLPAPATAALLAGWPVRPGVPGREEVTPTGAALMAALARPGTMPEMTLLGVGVGAGTRDFPDRPNIVRALLGERAAADSPTDIWVLCAQMDDLTGEHLPPLLEAVLAAGALDVYASPVLMKKGRSGLLVTALSDRSSIGRVEEALLRHGSTFGVRRHRTARRVLDRRHVTVSTPFGAVRIKLGSLDGELLHAAPEFEDVRQRAEEAGVPVARVHDAAIASWHTMGSEVP